ncbi:hypothetical protein GcM1_176004, partial [Golovinomyces cichoracearum]
MASESTITNMRGKISNFENKLDLNGGTPSIGNVNGFISWRIEIYKDSNYRDYSLWEAYVEDFDKFTKETFEIA